MNKSRSLAPIFIFAFVILVIAGLVWANYRIAQSNAYGEGFSIQWIGIQSLFKAGKDPYSEQVTAQIQATVHKENSFVEDTFPKYTSPLYSSVLIFPFVMIGEKTIAHSLWMTAQILAIFAMLILCLRLTGWKPTWYAFFLLAIFTIFSYHVVDPWLDGGLSIWAAFFLLLALIAINANRSELGGVLLALTAVQPQMVILPLFFILIWSLVNKKTVIILWFFISLILLSVIALFLVPGWIMQYARLLYNFSNNFPPGNPGIFFRISFPGLGKQLGWLVSGLLAVILIIEWILSLRKDTRWLLWTASLTMVISQWIGIPIIPGNFIELIIPLMLISALFAERWSRAGQWVAVLITVTIFAWEWALFYLDLIGPHPNIQLNLIFPLPAILLLGLYWVRWWAIKPRRLLMEELRLSET